MTQENAKNGDILGMGNTIKFIKSTLDRVTCPDDKSEVVYSDQMYPNLKFRIRSGGKKTFLVRRKLNGKAKRVTLGEYPNMTIEQARKAAGDALSTISDGIDPIAVKRANAARSITVSDCLDSYLLSHTNLKKGTEKTYRRNMSNHLSDWMDTPMLSITRDKIEKRHRDIGKRSQTSANAVMRVLRALFEYAHGKYEDENGNPIILHNPVKRLSQAKAWFKETRRSGHLKPSEIKPWIDTVTTTPDWLKSASPELFRDYLLLILFTGLRRNEAASLRWSDIDFEQRVLTITDTKNGYPHALPLSDYLYDLLSKRSVMGGEFVFPGAGIAGHMTEPKKAISKVRDKSGLHFTLHDLRRTFITTAEGLGIRDYTLKRLLNHRSGGDVTDGYIVSDVERLREPMQQVTDKLLMLAKKPDNVLTFPSEKIM